MDQTHAPYFEALCAYAQVDRAAFHRPGHIQGRGARLSVNVMAATYPPGIPVVVPGERLTPALVAHLAAQVAAGGRIVGPQDPKLDRIQVVCE